MFSQPNRLKDGTELTWRQVCSVESGDSHKLSFCELGIIRNQGLFGLIQIFCEDDPDENLPLLPCTYDVLFQLHHPWNKSYFVGYKNGKCALLRITAHAYQAGEEDVAVCRVLSDPEYDSIAWNGGNMIVLYQGELCREYHPRTHMVSEAYECLW